VEVAPLDSLPHAKHVFLEQIAHNLWNGCYFYLNGPHVLQAGPQSFEDDTTPIPEGETSRYPSLKPFKDKGLETLPFPEYSDQFPHETCMDLGISRKSSKSLLSQLSGGRKVEHCRQHGTSCDWMVRHVGAGKVDPLDTAGCGKYTMLIMNLARHCVPFYLPPLLKRANPLFHCHLTFCNSVFV
jgi:hypothetical protein